MNYNKERIKGWLVFTIQGELDIIQSDDYDMLNNDVRNEVIDEEYKFFFDLNAVPYIDSSGLSILIFITSIASKNGSTIKVCGLNDITKKVFRLLKAHHVFEVYKTREQAVNSL